ncbi:hypothetical protein A1F99_127640 [Pyrenophora tritici-repentis]|nr:hypothetical protein A1F99_127640 [Pyrenophora tritici-repentis]
MHRLFHLLVALFSLCLLVSGDSYCGTTSNITMFDPSSLHTRSMTYLKFAVARPWPLRDGPTGPIRPIRYCYANKEAQEELSCLLMAGFDVWARALGFPHSHTVGHNLCWKSIVLRTTSGTPPFYSPFCYLDDYKNHEDPGTWNPVVADDALVVHLTEGTPAATVGWQPGEKEGRHKLLLPKTIGVTRVAHEVSSFTCCFFTTTPPLPQQKHKTNAQVKDWTCARPPP